MGKTYVGDIGTKIETTLNTSLVGISTAKYYIKKHDGSLATWTCIVDSTTTGIVSYNAVNGDFDVAGKYYIQTQLVFADGSTYWSETESFRVYSRYF